MRGAVACLVSPEESVDRWSDESEDEMREFKVGCVGRLGRVGDGSRKPAPCGADMEGGIDTY